MTPRKLLAEFSTADALTDAVRAMATAQKGRRFETYTPYSIPGLEEIAAAQGSRPSPVRTVMVIAAAVGAALMFFLQYWSSVEAYPFNSGGRPYNAWPAFMLTTFEITILSAAIGGFVTLVVTGRLGKLYNPVFDWDGIERASDDRFMLEVELDPENKSDPVVDRALSDLLRQHGALSVRERAA